MGSKPFIKYLIMLALTEKDKQFNSDGLQGQLEARFGVSILDDLSFRASRYRAALHELLEGGHVDVRDGYLHLTPRGLRVLINDSLFAYISQLRQALPAQAPETDEPEA
ncbi:MAG: hypothetical protein WCV84_00940 [Patescibacteria group bacterium]